MSNAAAVTLDWDVVAWTPGSLSNSYNIDPANAGNDVTFTLSGNTNRFADKAGSAMPAVLNIIEGGLSPVQKSLVLHVDLTTQSEGITLTVNFSSSYTAGVSGVSFSVFDIDQSANFQDQLRSIRALAMDGTTWIAPTITTSSSNTLTGTGLAQVVNGTAGNTDTGPTSGNGNVLISFGNTPISMFSFVYGSGTVAPTDPGTQGISLHDFSFTPVPEINPAWSAVACCLLVAGLVFRHRANLRK